MARTFPNSLPIYPELKAGKMREYQEGERLSGGLKFRPAPYLPVKKFDQTYQIGVVIEKGDVVTLDQFGFLVPAFQGEKTLSYTAIDVQLGVFDLDSFTGKKDDQAVSAAKTTTKKIGTTDTANVKIGAPIGVAMYDIFQWDLERDPWFQVQPEVAVLCDKAILLALDPDHASVSYLPGQLLMVDDKGFPVPFDGNAAKLQYVIGRLVKVIDVAADPDWLGGVQNVVYFPEAFRPTHLPGRQSMENASVVVTEGIDQTTKKGLVIQLQL